MNCPLCGNAAAERNGVRRGVIEFRCRDCNLTFKAHCPGSARPAGPGRKTLEKQGSWLAPDQSTADDDSSPARDNAPGASLPEALTAPCVYVAAAGIGPPEGRGTDALQS